MADKRISLVFDSLRSPADLANIIQLALAKGLPLHLCGNSIRHDHPKVWGKVMSWCDGEPHLVVAYHPNLAQCIHELRSQGVYIIGTSAIAELSYVDADFSGESIALVFGTETSGLTEAKQAMTDLCISVPMQESPLRFLTLSVVVPILVEHVLSD